MKIKQAPLNLVRWVYYSIAILVVGVAVFTSYSFVGTQTISLHPGAIVTALSSWYFIFCIPLLTCANLFLRFLRWVFLLRTFRCIHPIKELFYAYLTAFIGNLFPLYLPYLLRIIPLKNNFYRGLFVLFIDLGIDIAAVVSLLYINSIPSLVLILVLFLILLAITIRLPSKGSDKASTPVSITYSLLLAYSFSILIWCMTASALIILLHDFGCSLPVSTTLALFSHSQISGLGTIIPAGIMTTGKTLLSTLHSQGISLDVATYSAVLLRLLTFWLTISISIAASLWYQSYNKKGAGTTAASPSHFDSLANGYRLEIPEYLRAFLLAKKSAINRQFLPHSRKLTGLDIGCGQGWYMTEMVRQGYAMVGIDYSFGQVHEAVLYGKETIQGRLCQGSITAVPVHDCAFDFIYTINTLHHLPSFQLQHLAFLEMYRVLKPGGICLVHEINVKNPLFRFYMSYIFPLVKNIDEGTEIWITGNEKILFDKFETVKTVYQTFLPDFLPRFMHKMLQPIESVAETIPVLQLFSAHLCIVLKKNRS
ncbi:MAG: methyltransferase domain-containing protein [Chitinivibrionales bacterium]|nr:methyltransferase domain-containing protein [Chitinivibrionales bacterium]